VISHDDSGFSEYSFVHLKGRSMSHEMRILDFDTLQQAVGSSAAFRCRRHLQPAGGKGDKVFPPTFAGAVYSVEQRRMPDRESAVTCVLLDSIQSQANRMELALQDALDAGKINLPLLVVDFSKHDPTGDVEADKEAGRLIDAIGRITSLQVPHRLADAILRDSQINGVDFRKSEKGKSVNTVSLANATPLFELCPTALVFGMWDSTGPKGGLGPKFERALVSEIVGIGAEVHDSQRTRGVRRDPLQVRAAVKVMKASDKSWTVAEPNTRGATEPSKVNHSSVPFDSANSGVTIEYGEQITTLSLICLRRLRFPLKGAIHTEIDLAAQTVLAALGLCAATLAFESGIGLRSRCLLWPDGPMEWELLHRPGSETLRFSLTGDQAIQLLQDSIGAATQKNLPWQTAPVILQPSPELLKLVRLSQLEATKEGPDEGK
jgi:CRISPR-associated protein Csb1